MVANTLHGGVLKTVPEAAAMLNVSRSHIYQLMDRGELSYVKLGKSRRIPEQALVDLVSKNTVPAR